MRGIYKVELKDPTGDEVREMYFTSIKAIYEKYSAERLGISKNYMRNLNIKNKAKFAKRCIVSYHIINQEN